METENTKPENPFISVDQELPKEGQSVIVSVHPNPIIMRSATFQDGEFIDKYDSVKLFPLYWKTRQNQ